MASTDTCCTLVPYFQVAEGKLAEFKALGAQFGMDAFLALRQKGARQATLPLQFMRQAGKAIRLLQPIHHFRILGEHFAGYVILGGQN